MTQFIRGLKQKQPAMVSIGLTGVALAVLIPAVASAASQSFFALGSKPQTGFLMSLTSNPGVVVPASQKNAQSLLGVVASPNDTAFDQQAGQISVTTDGAATALVSTLGGDISVGDRIEPSSVLGIGQKLTGGGWIVGTAQASLDAHTKGAIQTTVTDANGSKRTTYIYNLPLVVKATYYTGGTSKESSAVPQSIQSLADSLAGKHVSTRALIFSFLLFLIGVLTAGMIVNSAIRGGMLAISRQPLTRKLIVRKVMETFGMAAIILAVVLAGSFLLLRIL